MSLWSDVSKEVGWEPREVAIPKPEAAMAAVDWARAGMCPALGELLTINRFAPGPKTGEEADALRIVAEGLAEVRPLFEGAA